MRKTLFSVFAFVAFATAGFANSTELKTESELTTLELFHPCNVLITVYDSHGNLVDHLFYWSHENPNDCVDSVGVIVKDFMDRYPGHEIKVSY